MRFNFPFLPAVVLLSSLIVPATAQVTCTTVSTPLLARSEGNTELVGDIIINCSGGVPTPAGLPVPQINIAVALNASLTSKVTAAGIFTEGLLLIDEPNAALPNGSHPLLNCGQVGGPDSGLSGAGVCEIISTGTPSQTYDGTPNAGPASLCASQPGVVPLPTKVYGCGRPNAFQGRLQGTVENVVEFIGVPFDPPAVGSFRTLRITNLRANATAFGTYPANIEADIAISGNPTIILSGSPLVVGTALTGLIASVPSLGVIRVEEGFASAFKDRNVAFTLANAFYSAGAYHYVPPDKNYPSQAAQNVPGVLYNTEDGFQWQNNGVNKPPSPDPPIGFSPFFTANLNYPLNSVGYGGLNTGISGDGVSSAGTRIALLISASDETVSLPPVVYLHPAGSPSTTSGVMVLTNTDPSGAGAFTPATTTTIHNSGMAVYEVLYSDPFLVEYADIPMAVSGPLHTALVLPELAPFYFGSDTSFPTPTAAHPTPTAIPRFGPSGTVLLLTSGKSLVP